MGGLGILHGSLDWPFLLAYKFRLGSRFRMAHLEVPKHASKSDGSGGERCPPKHTGEIWQLECEQRELMVEAVCKKLQEAYGLPRHDNPDRPLDDLIYIILSNKTTASLAWRLFGELKQRFKIWEDLLDTPIGVLIEIIKPGGLSAKNRRRFTRCCNG